MAATTETLELEDVRGVGPETAKKLMRTGFTTIQSLGLSSAREIASITGIPYDTAVAISQNARMLMGDDLIRAIDLYKRRQEAFSLKTRVKALDALLGGGFESQAVTELVGEYASGKTQICLQLCVLVQRPHDEGGLSGRGFYLDTEGTFNPKRVYDIALGMDLNPEETLTNIYYARAYNSDHQTFLVDRLPSLIQKENIRLLIVDSVISHFRSEYIGREMLAERQQKLNNHLHKLLRLAEAFNMAVVITNQIQSNPQAFFGDPNRPAGGNVLAHAATHRLYLRRKSPGRIARIIDSASLPPGEALFQITGRGVEDIDEKTTSKLAKSNMAPDASD